MAQSHVRIEFGGIPYDPALSPAAQLYNMYFSGSMSGVVFQELREVRALAYMVGAQYRPGDRRSDPNMMVGVIQTQSDKTCEAVRAFVELLDNLPLSADRYALAREALLNDYRAGRTGFRKIPRVLLDWERRGLKPDPRRQWYEEISAATSIDLLAGFHKEQIAGRNKLISIVGESTRVNLPELNTTGAFMRSRSRISLLIRALFAGRSVCLDALCLQAILMVLALSLSFTRAEAQNAGTLWRSSPELARFHLVVPDNAAP